MGTDLKLVLTTCGNREIADRLALALVERRLAACVNVLPAMNSIYRWAGTVERADEVLVIIKTAREQLMAVERAIKEISGYELPEVLAIDVAGGSADYLSWVADSVSGGNT